MDLEKKCAELQQELDSKTEELNNRVADYREKQLSACFDFFNLDGDGILSEAEFFEIGKVHEQWANYITDQASSRRHCTLEQHGVRSRTRRPSRSWTRMGEYPLHLWCFLAVLEFFMHVFMQKW